MPKGCKLRGIHDCTLLHYWIFSRIFRCFAFVDALNTSMRVWIVRLGDGTVKVTNNCYFGLPEIIYTQMYISSQMGSHIVYNWVNLRPVFKVAEMELIRSLDFKKAPLVISQRFLLIMHSMYNIFEINLPYNDWIKFSTLLFT